MQTNFMSHVDQFHDDIIVRNAQGIILAMDAYEVSALYFNHKLLRINLPNFIKLKVIEAEHGIKGDTAKGYLRNIIEMGDLLKSIAVVKQDIEQKSDPNSE